MSIDHLVSLVAALLLPPGPVLVSGPWLVAHRADPGLVVLHVAMDRADYDAGHVPGARFTDVMAFHGMGSDALLPVEQLARATRELGLDADSRIVLVGAPMGTAIVFVALDYLGWGDRISILDGGPDAWRRAGGTLSRDPVSIRPSTYTPRARTDVVVDADWVSERLGRPTVALLDARSPREYAGRSTAEQLPRYGHLPGARSLEWTRTVAAPAGDTSRFPGAGSSYREPAVLAHLVRAAGATPGDTVVTYCTVGMRASHLYLVARLLGYETRLYVGSMADWSRRDALPIETGPDPHPVDP